jgi:hypothetical protein
MKYLNHLLSKFIQHLNLRFLFYKILELIHLVIHFILNKVLFPLRQIKFNYTKAKYYLFIN